MKTIQSIWALIKFYQRSLPRGWWRKKPFLPIPPKDYLAWRWYTAYGVQRPAKKVVLNNIIEFGNFLRKMESLKKASRLG